MNSLSRPVALVVAVVCCMLPAVARGQAGYTTWSQVEAAKETRDYKEKLRDGGSLDAAAKAYLVEIALPQLAGEANRRTIDRVRRRMRELLLTEISDDKAFEDASRTVRDAMLAMARDEQADLPVRVNALLLIGDLKARDGKPWPGAVATLATALREAKLPTAVRVAAMAGLARHADAARTAADDAAAAFAKDAAPAVLPIIAAAAKPVQPPAGRDADAIWMTSRALAMLPVAVRGAPKDLAAAVAAIMSDASWPMDVRVRAAAALGAAATAQSGVNAAQAIEAIRGLAVAALEADIAAAERRLMENEYRGGSGGQAGGVPGFAPPPGGLPGSGFGFGGDAAAAQPADAGAIPEQVARRDAWRLVALADAVLTADGKRGLATLAGKAADGAAALAAVLRENGISLDASPTEDTVVAALESLRAPQATAAPRPAQPADKPVAPTPEPEPAASPFDASPFGQ